MSSHHAHPDAAPPPHAWRFFRAGGFDQVSLDSGADLLALGQLDQKLWVALSCPAGGIEFDARTLELIDTDRDGHIRAAEIIAAAQWAGEVLKDADRLIGGHRTLPLTAIDTETEEGRNMLAVTRRILQRLGKPDAEAITLADMTDTHKLVAAMHFNGDGIVPPQSVRDAELETLLQQIVDCCGAESGRGGEQGVSAAIAERFFDQAEAYAAWWNKAAEDCDIWFLGAETPAAADAWRAVRAKVGDYFTRCSMAAYDARAAAPLSRSVEDYQALATQDLDAAAAAVAAFPLAVIEAGKPLPLHDALNPAWTAAMHALHDKVVAPLLGKRDSLTEAEWRALCAKFAAFEDWLARKPETGVEQLGIERIRAVLDRRDTVLDLIRQDLALADEVDAIASVERLLHYCRDLHALANNFVSFRNFYTGAGKAVFQAGTLYLDGRSCELCVRVDDVAKHAALAGLSRVCLVYCECTRDGGAEKMFIAAAVTAGDSGQLMAGRNGVFYDRQGRDWDATIVRMLEHPISVRQAFWQPYRRAGRVIGEQIQKFAAARSEAAQARMAKSVLDAADKPGGAKPQAFDVAKFAGIFAAIGLAVGALGTAIASMMAGLLALAWWKLPFVVLGLLLAVSGPSMLLAWFKLRQRSLGPILDANGWAVNARARINIPFGASLTAVAQLPDGAERSLVDPYAEKKCVWPFYLAAAVVAGMLLWGMWLVGAFR